MNAWKCLICGERREIPPMQHVCAECAAEFHQDVERRREEFFSRTETGAKDGPTSFLAECALEMAATVATLKRWKE